MRRALLVLILLLPVPAHAQALDVELVSITFDVAPETWKNRAPTQEAAADDIGVWSASLGLYVELEIRVQRGGQDAESTWAYQATLTDGITQVAGYVRPDGPGMIIARFDVDGQRAHSGQPAVAPLQSGTWRVEVVASQGERLEGRGGASFETQELDLQIDEPGVRIPQSILPHVREIGIGADTWMALEAQHTPLTVVLDSDGGRITWNAWVAISGPSAPIQIRLPVPGVPDPLVLTPVGGNDPTDLATTWLHTEVATLDAPPGPIQYLFQIPEDPALFVLTAHSGRGGMAHFVLPARGGDFGWEEILAEPGTTGPVAVTVHGPTEVPLPAEFHVLDPMGATLATSVLVPAGDHVWRGIYDGISTRNAGAPHTVVVAFFQDAFGGYAGHVAALRGIQANFLAGTLGVGEPGNLDLELRHLHPLRDAALSLPALVDVQFANTALGTSDISLGAGTKQVRSHPITPDTAGAHPATVTIDTGDLLFTLEQDVEVLSPQAYEDATAPWYDVPGPAMPWIVAALALLALRKREI